MADGTEIRIKRDRALLKDNAIIPTIFPEPDLPPSKEEIRQNNRKEFLRNNGGETDFSKISSQANLILLPSVYWFVNSLRHSIQWSSWSKNLIDSPKRMMVGLDKSTTVSFNYYFKKAVK